MSGFCNISTGIDVTSPTRQARAALEKAFEESNA